MRMQRVLEIVLELKFAESKKEEFKFKGELLFRSNIYVKSYNTNYETNVSRLSFYLALEIASIISMPCLIPLTLCTLNIVGASFPL